MDWNWFFSSLAQSSAAIVGFFGAFTITKILSNETAFSEKKNRLKELLSVAEKIKDDADVILIHNKGFIADKTPLTDWATGETQKAIKSVKLAAHHHIRLISDFLDTIEGNPESSSLINLILTYVSWMFFIGVLYPLSLLPTPPNWDPSSYFFHISFESIFQINIKVGLLFLMSFIFVAFIGMLFSINARMRYDADDVEKLKLFKSIETYAQYFAIMESNRE